MMECDWVVNIDVVDPPAVWPSLCPGGDSQMPAGNGALYCAKHHEEFYRWFVGAVAP